MSLTAREEANSSPYFFAWASSIDRYVNFDSVLSLKNESYVPLSNRFLSESPVRNFWVRCPVGVVS